MHPDKQPVEVDTASYFRGDRIVRIPIALLVSLSHFARISAGQPFSADATEAEKVVIQHIIDLVIEREDAAILKAKQDFLENFTKNFIKKLDELLEGT